MRNNIHSISGYFFIKRVDFVNLKTKIVWQEAFRSNNLPRQLSIDLGGWWEDFEFWRRKWNCDNWRGLKFLFHERGLYNPCLLLLFAAGSGIKSPNVICLIAGRRNSPRPFIFSFGGSAAICTASRQTLSRGFLLVLMTLNLMADMSPSRSGCFCWRCGRRWSWGSWCFFRI